MNKEYYEGDNIEISFKDLLWKLFEQWRAVLVVAIIAGLLCSGLMYVNDKRAYQAELLQKEENQAAIEAEISEEQALFTDEENRKIVQEQLAQLSDADKLVVESLLQTKNAQISAQNYGNHSLLMRVDAENEHVYQQYYRIVLPDGDRSGLSDLVSAYKDVIPGEQMAEALKEILGADEETRYIEELISIDTAGASDDAESANNDDTILVLTFILPSDVNTQQLGNEAKALMTEESANLSGSVFAHTLECFRETEKVRIDQELLSKQEEYANLLLEFVGRVRYEEEYLTPVQKTAYDSILSQIANVASGTVDEETVVGPAPSVNPKWFAVGFIVGIILYAVLYLIWVVLIRRVRVREDLERGWGMRVLGELYEYHKAGVARLVNSKRIFNLRHKGKTDVCRQIDEIVESLSSSSTRKAISEILLVPVVKSDGISAKRFEDAILPKLQEKLSDQAVEISVGCTFSKTGALDEKQLLNAKGIVPVIVAGETSPNMMNLLLNGADFYGADILGSIFVEN